MKKINLKTYSTIAATLVATSSIQAEVVFTDIDPDSTLINHGENFAIDLNGDLINDFNISLEHVTSYSVGIQNLQPGNYYAFEQTSVYTDIKAFAFTYGDPINNSSISNWGTSLGNAKYKDNIGSYGTSWGSQAWGFFHTTPDQYLGLKFQIDGEVHFAWVQLSVAPLYQSVTIQGYAYETCPNTSINAGQTIGSCIPTTIGANQTISENDWLIYPNPVQDVAHVILPDGINNSTLNIIDMNGKIIISKNTLTGNTAKINTDKLITGTYIIELVSANNISRKKLIKL